MWSTLRAVQFVYRGDGDAVAVVGSFNHWDPQAHPLRRVDGAWQATVYLPPGTYPYAFAVGGRRVPDPDSRRALRGPLGDRYSILVVPEHRPAVKGDAPASPARPVNRHRAPRHPGGLPNDLRERRHRVRGGAGEASGRPDRGGCRR